MSDTLRAQLEAEILSLPPAVAREYLRARELLASTLDGESLDRWILAGREIARQSFRAWEAAAEYFRVSPEFLGPRLQLPYLDSWTAVGRQLAAASASLSVAYFRASPQALSRLSPHQLATWASQGQRLYRGTWKSSTLAAHFFEVSPLLLDSITLEELSLFAAFLETLSLKSHELAEECLTTAETLFATLAREDVRPLISLLQRTAETNWKYSKESLQMGSLALARVEPRQRARFLKHAEEMVALGGRRHLALLNEGSQGLHQLRPALHGPALDMFEGLHHLSRPAAVEFLKSVPRVLARVQQEALSLWYAEGARVLAENEAAGTSYFKLESSRGETLLQTLSARLDLKSVLPVLQLYGLALTGQDLDIRPSQTTGNRGVSWASVEQASTDGRSVFLPLEVAQYETKEENFSWYKVLTTHQTGHLEFDSFHFAFEGAGALFPNWRAQVEEKREDRAPLADFQRFFDLFPDRQLAADIFTIVEDSRIDYIVLHHYAGLRSTYNLIRTGAVAGRPAPEELPLREALLETLMRMTLLESPSTISVLSDLRPLVDRVAAILRHLRSPEATVEDSAEATFRIYRLLSQVPNVVPPQSGWEQVDVGELGQDDSGSDLMDTSPQEAQTAGSVGDSFQMVPNQGEPEEAAYKSPQPVDYRGEFKPELVQVVANLRETQQDQDQTAPMPIDQDALRRFAEQSTEINLDNVVEGQIEDSAGLFITQLMNELLQNVEKAPEPEAGRRARRNIDNEGPLEAAERTFLYDEWDFKANDYKPRWCSVREVPVTEGTTEFYDRTLEHHSALVSEIRRQFERMAPEMYRKVKHLPDGEEFDLDAVIEAIIERRAGALPSEKVYWRRNKIQRDVSVIFLLDMSASTAEAIDEKASNEDEWRDIPDDPREYLFWLRARREVAKRNYKRIIDIERESTVLLIRALETIGDQYGIYGFSGYGRENVEFYTIKDIDQPFSDEVARRIDGVAPLHATRMGPAIRHATSKLRDRMTRTKILFLISDGRPQDRGYSREGVEKEYAVQDTHKALIEAKALGITPFCLTIDRAGHDYMKEMCGDLAYEVLEDVTSLPVRLPQLYRRLTV